MENIRENFDTVTTDELRDLLLEQKRVQSLSREELISELNEAGVTQKTTLKDMEIHPLSHAAIAAASPGQAQIKTLKSVLPWEWTVIVIGTLLIFYALSIIGNS